MQRARGADQFQNLFADAVHVHGERYPAEENQRETKFFLTQTSAPRIKYLHTTRRAARTSPERPRPRQYPPPYGRRRSETGSLPSPGGPRERRGRSRARRVAAGAAPVRRFGANRAPTAEQWGDPPRWSRSGAASSRCGTAEPSRSSASAVRAPRGRRPASPLSPPPPPPAAQSGWKIGRASCR